MTHPVRLALCVDAQHNGWSKTAITHLGPDEVPFAADAFGEVNLREHPRLVARLLRDAADRLDPR